MLNDPNTVHKLIILYMLNKTQFMMTHTQLKDIFLSKEWMSYFSFQNVIAELVESKLIAEHKTKVTQKYNITDEGITTLSFFEDKIDDEVKNEINDYLAQNKIKIKLESSITGDFTEGPNNNYIAYLDIIDGKDTLIKMELEIPDADAALTICEKWKNNASKIYKYIIEQLL